MVLLLKIYRKQVDHREDEHPDQIDEVPIQPADLYVFVRRTLSNYVEGDYSEIDDAARYVRHMKAGDAEEGGAELRHVPWIFEKLHMLVQNQARPFIAVQAYEGESAEHSRDEP